MLISDKARTELAQQPVLAQPGQAEKLVATLDAGNTDSSVHTAVSSGSLSSCVQQLLQTCCQHLNDQEQVTDRILEVIYALDDCKDLIVTVCDVNGAVLHQNEPSRRWAGDYMTGQHTDLGGAGKASARNYLTQCVMKFHQGMVPDMLAHARKGSVWTRPLSVPSSASSAHAADLPAATNSQGTQKQGEQVAAATTCGCTVPCPPEVKTCGSSEKPAIPGTQQHMVSVVPCSDSARPDVTLVILQSWLVHTATASKGSAVRQVC